MVVCAKHRSRENERSRGDHARTGEWSSAAIDAAGVAIPSEAPRQDFPRVRPHSHQGSLCRCDSQLHLRGVALELTGINRTFAPSSLLPGHRYPGWYECSLFMHNSSSFFRFSLTTCRQHLAGRWYRHKLYKAGRLRL